MKLSIGMIVKNEERYLRRCLEAIRPVLDQVDSELIIADTGSTDDTPQIARDFTDQVFFFEWCNDFSAARNSTLEKAKGEWFMSLDADEIFEDVSALVEFFNSGEYKKFNSATYIIRNSNKEDLSTYSDFDALRLGLIESDTCYAGRIHETRPYYEPTKKLDSVALHYGYISEGNRDFIAMKTRRNLDILLSELEQDPENCRLLLQIGQTYCINSDFLTGLTYLKKGLQLAKQKNDTLLYHLYGDIARVYYVLKQYSDVIHITQEYFKNRKNKNGIDIQMYFLAGSCHAKEMNDPEAIFAFVRYLDLYEEYQKKGSRSSDPNQYPVDFADTHNWRIACLNLATSYLHVKDPSSARSILDRIPLSEWPDKDTFRPRLSAELDYIKAADDYSRLTELFAQSDRDLEGFVRSNIEKQLEDVSRRDLILKSAATLDPSSAGYPGLMRLRYDHFCGDSLTKQSVKAYLDTVLEWAPPFTEAIFFALQSGIEIPYLTAKVNAFDLHQLLFSGAFRRFPEFPLLVCELLAGARRELPADSALWLSFLAMWGLTSDSLNDEQAISLFRDYVTVTDRFLNTAYREDFLTEENSELLPFPLRVGYFCDLAINALESGDRSEYVECLKIVLRMYPGFKHVIEILLNELQKSLDSPPAQSAVLAELEQYAAIVKSNIVALIGSGESEQAAELLTAYEQICPTDPEIPDLKNMIKPGMLH